MNDRSGISDPWHHYAEKSLDPGLRQIVNDENLWIRLEFLASDFLYNSEDKLTRHIWVDGFSPEYIRRSPSWVEVKGNASVVNDPRYEEYEFLAFLAPDLIRTENPPIVIKDIRFDHDEQSMEIIVRRKTDND